MSKRDPFLILPTMFAIKWEGKSYFVLAGEDGYRQLKSPQAIDGWAILYARQTEAERRSAIAGSMFGWSCPAASAAKDYVWRAIRASAARGGYEAVP